MVFHYAGVCGLNLKMKTDAVTVKLIYEICDTDGVIVALMFKSHCCKNRDSMY